MSLKTIKFLLNKRWKHLKKYLFCVAVIFNFMRQLVINYNLQHKFQFFFLVQLYLKFTLWTFLKILSEKKNVYIFFMKMLFGHCLKQHNIVKNEISVHTSSKIKPVITAHYLLHSHFHIVHRFKAFLLCL